MRAEGLTAESEELSMRFGILQETGCGKGVVERRVALSPAGVRELCQAGAEVVVQHGAGRGAGFTNVNYSKHKREEPLCS